MQTALSKSTALKLARAAVSAPSGRGTSWTIYGPYESTYHGLNGPRTEVHASNYWEARDKRAKWVVELTLRLMGWDPDSAAYATYESRRIDIEGMLHEAIAQGPQFSESK